MTRTRPDIMATRVKICNHRFFIHVLKYFLMFSTSILPKVSLRKILAKMTVNIGLADKIIFWTESGICCRAKYATRQWPQEMTHLHHDLQFQRGVGHKVRLLVGWG